MKKYLLLNDKEYGQILEKHVVFKGSHQMGRIKTHAGRLCHLLVFGFWSDFLRAVLVVAAIL
jgi:hypothetical protein